MVELVGVTSIGSPGDPSECTEVCIVGIVGPLPILSPGPLSGRTFRLESTSIVIASVELFFKTRLLRSKCVEYANTDLSSEDRDDRDNDNNAGEMKLRIRRQRVVRIVNRGSLPIIP